METVSIIVSVAIALVLVLTKLILEHQYEVDKANGAAGDKSEYTMKGMLRLMRAERKAEKTESMNMTRTRLSGSDERGPRLSVKGFRK